MNKGDLPFHHPKRASLADLPSSSTSSKVKTTLLKENNETEYDYLNSHLAHDNDQSQLAIHRDGISSTATRDALRLLSNASRYIPGGSNDRSTYDLSSLQ